LTSDGAHTYRCDAGWRRARPCDWSAAGSADFAPFEVCGFSPDESLKAADLQRRRSALPAQEANGGKTHASKEG
jgi:hypothetical protein